MQIERFRNSKGLQIRAANKADRPLFRHCAGDDYVNSRNAKRVEELLFIHGVNYIETCNHPSVKLRKAAP